MVAQTEYDVVIVGAGAGGGTIACVLAEAGKRVLLLERGTQQGFKETGRDHLRNQRLSQYGNNAGPNGPNEPRVFVDFRTGHQRTVLPHEGGYHNNAAVVGGGTLVYGGQAWRFTPTDFRMASTYGVPPGSSLADWPIGYDDLAPFYERVEHELGVCGRSSEMTHLPSYQADYPLPPQELNRQGQVLRRGLAHLGWDALSVPLAINSQPYQNRPACIRCQHCVGFACPVNAKNGTQNTFLPRALQTGNATLLTGVLAERIEQSGGRVWGVTYRDTQTGTQTTVRASVVVAAGGAVETARLLLSSGLGNNHVGRHLQGHYYPGATARFAEPVWDGLGPGVTTATCKWIHNNPGIIGGGMLADEFIPLPITFWKRHTPPHLPRWGQAAKNWMREHYRFVTDVKGPVQEIPSPDSRVSLDENVRDKWGNSVARLGGATHEETVRTSAFMHDRAVEWLQAAGAVEIWGGYPQKGLSGGQHQAGTCRMSDDPEAGVTDRFCRVHGQDNLYLGDGSVHVTNGPFNPFLTIMALAYRTADHICQSW